MAKALTRTENGTRMNADLADLRGSAHPRVALRSTGGTPRVALRSTRGFIDPPLRGSKALSPEGDQNKALYSRASSPPIRANPLNPCSSASHCLDSWRPLPSLLSSEFDELGEGLGHLALLHFPIVEEQAITQFQ